MATERARRSEDGEVDERRERVYEAPPAESNVALLMQRSHGNQAVARMLSRTPRVLARGFDPEFTFGGAGIEKETVDKKGAAKAVETVVEDELGGFRNLFWKNDVATSQDEWAELVLGLMRERYELDGVAKAEVLAGIKTLKAKHREQVLLHLAKVYVYDSEEGGPWSKGNLVTRLTDSGAYLDAEEQDDGSLEGDDAAALSAIFDTEGGFARTQVEFDTAMNVQLLDEDNIVVIIDHHQQKHQRDKIPEFPAYSGDPGSKFASGKGLEWHRTNTAVAVKAFVLDAVSKKLVTATKDYTFKKTPRNGIVYDLLISYDPPTGKWVGSYHCNPLRNED